MREFEITQEGKAHLLEQLTTKKWEELEVLEHYGYLLFPETLYKRGKGGEFDKLEIMMRVPRPHEQRKCRVAARAVALKEGLDLSRDRDLVDDIETIHVLAESIRNTSEPYERMMPPEELEAGWDKPCLVQLWAKLDALIQMVDPRPEEISNEEVMAVISRLAQEDTAAPLAVYGPGVQTFLLRTMAALSLSYLGSKSSSGSPEPSALASFQRGD